jgi:cytochrome c peroxidase
MSVRTAKVSIILIFTLKFTVFYAMRTPHASADGGDRVDQQLSALLEQNGFTGEMSTEVEKRLGRHIDNQLADLGRNLFFDTVGGLNDDNSCAGCHAPSAGFGDTQSIAIGIDNNGVVGPQTNRAPNHPPPPRKRKNPRF